MSLRDFDHFCKILDENGWFADRSHVETSV
jgi:hypothetical protein